MTGRTWGACVLAGLLGIASAAVAILPLGAYLMRSPVWGDRAARAASVWTVSRPRVLDAVCTAFPYAYGSQRRGHPNLARALGVHNLNESAGGFAGLVVLLWLAPLAVATGGREPRVRFLLGLAGVGALGAFDVAPVANLLRAVPVLNVTDNRRLTLWVAFGLVLLGGIGIDRLAGPVRGRRWRGWVAAWIVAAAGLALASVAVARAEPWLRARALAHIHATTAPGAIPAAPRTAEVRADRQVHSALAFLPRYGRTTAVTLLAMGTLGVVWLRGGSPPAVLRALVLALAVAEWFGFGRGLNPAIGRRAWQTGSPVLEALRRGVGREGRVLGLGAELLPNTAMRAGLADVRNYDSIELTRALDWLAPLYGEPGAGARAARTSRREVIWAGVVRARPRLVEAGVRAVVAATPPPPRAFDRVDRIGAVWVGWLPGAPRVAAESGVPLAVTRDGPGRIGVDVRTPRDDRIVVRETFDPGWKARVDGRDVPVAAHRGAFLAVPVPPGTHRVELRYDPAEVRWGLGISLMAWGGILGALVGPIGTRSARKNRSGSWTARNRRVKIETSSSAGILPATH